MRSRGNVQPFPCNTQRLGGARPVSPQAEGYPGSTEAEPSRHSWEGGKPVRSPWSRPVHGDAGSVDRRMRLTKKARVSPARGGSAAGGEPGGVSSLGSSGGPWQGARQELEPCWLDAALPGVCLCPPEGALGGSRPESAPSPAGDALLGDTGCGDARPDPRGGALGSRQRPLLARAASQPG